MPSTTTTLRPVIFTDLDGTLLDRDTYSFEAARPALDAIADKGIPLVLVSSKTRFEIESVRKRLKNPDPFVSENGGAVFIPRGYFPSLPLDSREVGGYSVLEIGVPYARIVEVLDSIRKETGVEIQGFSDLTPHEIASLTGLDIREAESSKRREYDEPFLVRGGEGDLEKVKGKIRDKGMSYAWGGRFHHLFGDNDKGRAVTLLKRLYAGGSPPVTTLGIGDSPNDFPLLLAVDHPVLLVGKESEGPPAIKGMTLVKGDGPRAWNSAVLDFLGRTTRDDRPSPSESL